MELFYGSIMPKIYGIGASVVIFGAMFKILHWPGADWMIGIGLTTEALIFFFSAFEPMHAEPDWAKVYPELSEEYDGPAPVRRVNGDSENTSGVSKKLDHMLESANIGPELIESLGKGMSNLSASVQKMSSLSAATLATDEYASNVKEANKSLVEVNKSYTNTAAAMNTFAETQDTAKEYQGQIKNMTKNLGSLNSVYEMELQDANSHVKAMNKFYANISTAMENMSDASKESEQFKGELTKLTSNLTSLNNVYGSMLSAMKG